MRGALTSDASASPCGLRRTVTIDPSRLVFIDESVLQSSGRRERCLDLSLLREAAQKMGDGPPGSAFRGGSQTGLSGGGKEPLS